LKMGLELQLAAAVPSLAVQVSLLLGVSLSLRQM